MPETIDGDVNSQDPSRSRRESGDAGKLTASQFVARTIVALEKAWKEWDASLPPQRAQWPVGAAYVRESDVGSLVGDAAIVQLKNTLYMMSGERIYVPWEWVFFENVSGTELQARSKFTELLDRCFAGEIKIIGAYLSSRLFRNAEEAVAVKRQLSRKGVRVMFLGKPVVADERDPNAWILERNIELADELHSRQTGWMVGRAKEHLSARGVPSGAIPECWRVVGWAPGVHPGHPGPPNRWELVEPLASVVREGAQRYVDGAGFQDLAHWSMTTDLKGFTPDGHPMGWEWWQGQLHNPRIAGYQWASKYVGYKPGKEVPRRITKSAEFRRNNKPVPCLLPPIITWAQFQQIQEIAAKRTTAPKRRERYRDEVLSGVAYSSECGHKMYIGAHRSGTYYMRCKHVATPGHGPCVFFRADGVEKQLVELIGHLRFDDALIARVAEELADREQQTPLATQIPSKEVLHLREALASLTDDSFADLRADIQTRLEQIERIEATPPAPPVLRYHASVEDLKHWPEVWERANADEKNGLLRAAGIRIYVAREQRPMHAHAPSRISAISAEVPEFALALATLLEGKVAPQLALQGSVWTEPFNARPRQVAILLPENRLAILRSVYDSTESLPAAA
jgi:hypothetical protein